MQKYQQNIKVKGILTIIGSSIFIFLFGGYYVWYDIINFFKSNLIMINNSKFNFLEALLMFTYKAILIFVKTLTPVFNY